MKKSLILTFALVNAIAARADDAAMAKLSHYPDAVQQTIKAHLSGGNLSDVTTDTEDDDVSYNADITRDGKTRSLSVAPDGQLLSEQVFMPELPEAVQKAIHHHVGKGGRVKEIDKSIEDGQTEYEIEMVKAHKTRHFTLAEDGNLVSTEVFSDEVSPEVRQTIEAQVGTGKLEEIDKSNDNGEVSYDVAMVKNGKTRGFSVSENGELTGVQVFLNEVPAAVKDAIKQRLGAGKLGDITKSTDNGKDTFDVDIESTGKTQTITFDASGSIIEE